MNSSEVLQNNLRKTSQKTPARFFKKRRPAQKTETSRSGMATPAGFEPATYRLASHFGLRRRLAPGIRQQAFVVWTIPSPWAHTGADRRLPSGLYTFPHRPEARGHGLGSGLPAAAGFPEFDRFCTCSFPQGTPLRRRRLLYPAELWGQHRPGYTETCRAEKPGLAAVTSREQG